MSGAEHQYSQAVPVRDPVTGDVQVKVIAESGQKDVYTCSLCDVGFLNIDDYLDHVLLHNKEGPGPSESKTSESAAKLSTVKRTAVTLQYKCCGGVYDTLEELRAHGRQCHTQGQDMKIDISEDATNSPAANSLDAMQETEVAEKTLQMINSKQGGYSLNSALEEATQGVYQCSVCHRILKDMFTLRTHQLTHSTERPYVCDYPGCDFSFKTKGSLKRHTRRHTGDRPFRCEMCGRSFRESGALTRHQKSRTPCTNKKDTDLPLYGKRKGFELANKDKIIHESDGTSKAADTEDGPSMLSIRLNKVTNFPEVKLIPIALPVSTENSKLIAASSRKPKVYRIVKQIRHDTPQQQPVHASEQEPGHIEKQPTPATPRANGYTLISPSQLANSTQCVQETILNVQPTDGEPIETTNSNGYTILSASHISNCGTHEQTNGAHMEQGHDSGAQTSVESFTSVLSQAPHVSLPIPTAPIPAPRSTAVIQGSPGMDEQPDPDSDTDSHHSVIQPGDAQPINASDRAVSPSGNNAIKVEKSEHTGERSSLPPMESLGKINIGGKLRTIRIVHGATFKGLENAKLVKLKTVSPSSITSTEVLPGKFPPALVKVKTSGILAEPNNASAFSSQLVNNHSALPQDSVRDIKQETSFHEDIKPNDKANEDQTIAKLIKFKTLEVPQKRIKIIKLEPKDTKSESESNEIRSKTLLKQNHISQQTPEVIDIQSQSEQKTPGLRNDFDLDAETTCRESGELSTGEILGLTANQIEQVEIVTSDAPEQSQNDDEGDDCVELDDVTKELEKSQGVPSDDRQTCNACGKTSRDADSMKAHLKTHLLFSGYSCPVEGCRSVVAGAKELVSHLQVVHRIFDSVEVNDDESAGQSRQSVDQETANTALRQLLELQGNLDTVMQTVGSQTVKVLHACPVCSRTFTLTYLKMHIRSHTGERPYQCKMCEKTFRTRDTLTKHMQSHNNARNYRCGECHKMFKRISHVREHLKVHSNERNYPCTKCDKSFKSANACKVHMRTHLHVLPHKCPHCTKSFREKSALERHVRTHTGEKPYVCKYCGRGFAEHGTLNRHLKAKVPCTSSFSYNYSKQQSVSMVDQRQDSQSNSSFPGAPRVSGTSVRVLRNLDDNRMLVSDTRLDDSSMDEPADMLHISLDSAASEPQAGEGMQEEGQDEGQNTVLAEFSTLAADAQQYVLDESGNAMQVVEVSEEQAEELTSSLYQEQSIVESLESSQPQYIVVGEEDGISSLLNPQTGETIRVSSQDLNNVVSIKPSTDHAPSSS